jgi:MFS family permease
VLICDNAGVGIAVQCGPLFLSEIAPYHLRGAFNTQFQLFITIGILLAQCINYANQDFEWGWRLNLSLAAVPALLLMVGAALVPDTPNSLVERGQEEKGKAMLRKIRGVEGGQTVLGCSSSSSSSQCASGREVVFSHSQTTPACRLHARPSRAATSAGQRNA